MSSGASLILIKVYVLYSGHTAKLHTEAIYSQVNPKLVCCPRTKNSYISNALPDKYKLAVRLQLHFNPDSVLQYLCPRKLQKQTRQLLLLTPEAFNLLYRLQHQEMSLGLERDREKKKKKGKKEERKASTIQAKSLEREGKR